MASNAALQWKSGRGWLIFSGGNTYGSPIRAEALARLKPSGHVAYISFAPDEGDTLMDDMEDLGAPSGYLVEVEGRTDDEVINDLKDASLVVLESSDDLEPMLEGLSQAVINGLEEAFQNGAVILIEGLGINLFGRWIMTDGGELIDGLNWVENGFLEPNEGGAEASYAIQAVVNDIPQSIAVSISPGSALALGFGGILQVLGQAHVTITVGSAYES
ncbi:hypothetical protein G4Y79_13855 [Phototrophicus methaneseepsis]|uniref:Uncharacterized protein n=1 Tax=Phototrophicus methaneseepsis TaxID=2710758 RepID=A0A7S8E5K0_9CHLR|nr:hypothetical protein [Phototrophicus methaneseepsis]QPC80793.1 hypothetical protein G4Y79_13855 [Phototrophicus methaneseepsis]